MLNKSDIKVMEYIMADYRRYVRFNEIKMHNYLNEGDDILFKLVDVVEYVIGELSNDLSFLIRNEYIENFTDSNWWIPFYSRSTYYRKKDHAVTEFLTKFRYIYDYYSY